MPIESTQHLYNLPGPQGWEEMRPYTNEKLIPAPLTTYSADRPYGRSASFGIRGKFKLSPSHMALSSSNPHVLAPGRARSIPTSEIYLCYSDLE